MRLPRSAPTKLDAWLEDVRAELETRVRPKAPPWGDLETLFCGAEWFGVTTATPLQRAICRCIDGVPIAELWSDPTVRRAFGKCPTEKPFEMAILAGVRSGKSLLAGACAVHWAWICDVSALGPGEMPRLPIVSVHKDLAQVVFGHISGRIQASERLRGLLVEPPSGERILLEHPTGRPIEITVSAGARAGVTLVARWNVGAIFDEFPRMVGGGEGVVNWKDMRDATAQRVLHGGGILDIGSPWAPFGPAFDLFTDHFGEPTKDIVVVKAPAPDLNPVHWNEKNIEAAKRNPDSYVTDVLAEFATPAGAMYPDVLLKRATRGEMELEPDEGVSYVAATDAGTRGNAWTLVIMAMIQGRLIVALSREWVGSRQEPLDPGEVLEEIGLILEAYGVRYLHGDQWSSDALKTIAKRYGVRFVEHASQGAEVFERYQRILDELKIDNIELPPDPMFQADMRRVKKVVTRLGMGIELPKTSDGRHCDYAPAFALACAQISPTKRPDVEPATAEEKEVREAAREKQEHLNNRSRDRDQPYWKRGGRNPMNRGRGDLMSLLGGRGR